MINSRLLSAFEYINKFYRDWRNAVIAVGLIAPIVVLLLLPAIKTIRTIEPKPEQYAGVTLSSGVLLSNDVLVPAGKLSYFISFVQDKRGGNVPKVSDYKSVVLEIKSQDGQIIRTATRPTLFSRSESTALLFKFKALTNNSSEHLRFDLRQTGSGSVLLRNPLSDNVKNGETASIGFQLGERESMFTLLIDKIYSEKLTKKDIASYLHRGQQIVRGENPYECTLNSGSCTGYPAHLPGMYLVAAGFVKIGVNDIATWSLAWRPVVFTAWFGVGAIIFVYIYRRKQPALAVAALGFWLFNRWSIEVLRIAHTDFLGVFFLLLAVVLVWRWPKTAAILFGVSIAIKQLAILVLPIFLLAVWHKKKMRLSTLATLVGLIAIVPILTLLPFFINNPKAVLQGLLFVAERPAQVVHGFAPSLEAWLDVTGIRKSVIMLFLIGVVYVATWRKSVNLIGGILMVMLIVMGLTSVLYSQYFIWFLPFIPLAIADMRKSK